MSNTGVKLIIGIEKVKCSDRKIEVKLEKKPSKMFSHLLKIQYCNFSFVITWRNFGVIFSGINTLLQVGFYNHIFFSSRMCTGSGRSREPCIFIVGLRTPTTWNCPPSRELREVWMSYVNDINIFLGYRDGSAIKNSCFVLLHIFTWVYSTSYFRDTCSWCPPFWVLCTSSTLTLCLICTWQRFPPKMRFLMIEK